MDYMERLLGNLLAVIHGDGGHYQNEHGSFKATEDAIVAINSLKIDRDALAKDAQRYRRLRQADPDSSEVAPMTHECNDWGQWYWLPVLGDSLDAAIDQAIKEGK